MNDMSSGSKDISKLSVASMCQDRNLVRTSKYIRLSVFLSERRT